MLEFVEEIEPISAQMWVDVSDSYVKWVIQYGYVARDQEALKQKFDRPANTHKKQVVQLVLLWFDVRNKLPGQFCGVHQRHVLEIIYRMTKTILEENTMIHHLHLATA